MGGYWGRVAMGFLNGLLGAMLLISLVPPATGMEDSLPQPADVDPTLASSPLPSEVGGSSPESHGVETAGSVLPPQDIEVHESHEVDGVASVNVSASTSTSQTVDETTVGFEAEAAEAAGVRVETEGGNVSTLDVDARRSTTNAVPNPPKPPAPPTLPFTVNAHWRPLPGGGGGTGGGGGGGRGPATPRDPSSGGGVPEVRWASNAGEAQRVPASLSPADPAPEPLEAASIAPIEPRASSLVDVVADHLAAAAILMPVLGAASLLGFLLRPVSGLFTRLQKSSLLDAPRRSQILEAIRARPWCTVKDLEESTSTPRSSLRHHLKVLRTHGLITVHQDGVMPRFHDRSNGPAPSYQPPLVGLLREELNGGSQRLARVMQTLVARQSYSRYGAWKAINSAARRGIVQLERREGSVWVQPGGGLGGPPANASTVRL